MSLTFLHLGVNVIDLHALFPVLLFTQNHRQQVSVLVVGVVDRTHGELAQLAVL